MAKNSTEFSYGGTTKTERIVKKSGPSWLLIIFYVAVSVLGILVLGIWWLAR
jgi:hypothetical protein